MCEVVDNHEVKGACLHKGDIMEIRNFIVKLLCLEGFLDCE